MLLSTIDCCEEGCHSVFHAPSLSSTAGEVMVKSTTPSGADASDPVMTWTILLVELFLQRGKFSRLLEFVGRGGNVLNEDFCGDVESGVTESNRLMRLLTHRRYAMNHEQVPVFLSACMYQLHGYMLRFLFFHFCLHPTFCLTTVDITQCCVRCS